MPFCPECGLEYEEGIKTCSDCEVELVDKLTEECFDGEMVEVHSTFSAAEAGMVKELLYNEGIFSAISNELGSTILGSTASGAGEVKVFVSESDEEDARELIENYIEDGVAGEGEGVCPHCGKQVDDDMEVCPSCGETLEEMDGFGEDGESDG